MLAAGDQPRSEHVGGHVCIRSLRPAGENFELGEVAEHHETFTLLFFEKGKPTKHI